MCIPGEDVHSIVIHPHRIRVSKEKIHGIQRDLLKVQTTYRRFRLKRGSNKWGSTVIINDSSLMNANQVETRYIETQ